MDYLLGTRGPDHLIFDAIDDATIKGRRGADVIELDGFANAWVYGGRGKDTFVFGNLARVDFLQDFKSGKDKIAFRGDILDAIESAGGPWFYKGDGYSNPPKASHRIIYDKAQGVLSIDLDGSGPIGDQQIAFLKPGTKLKLSDILLLDA